MGLKICVPAVFLVHETKTQRTIKNLKNLKNLKPKNFSPKSIQVFPSLLRPIMYSSDIKGCQLHARPRACVINNSGDLAHAHRKLETVCGYDVFRIVSC